MITLNKVSKHFRSNCVFEQIDYAFADGLVYCVQGINGSGKTVLLKLIAGLLEPDEGRISFNKKDVRKGVIIETPRFWKHMSGLETLRFLASVRGEISEETILEYMAKTGTIAYKDKRVGSYSLGMKQRLAIAQAMMEDPDILLLDEPTNALDESGLAMLKGLLKEEKEKGKTILIATHNLDDLEDVIDRQLKIRDRRLVEWQRG